MKKTRTPRWRSRLNRGLIAIAAIAEELEKHPELERVRMVCFDERTKAYYDRALAESGAVG